MASALHAQRPRHDLQGPQDMVASTIRTTFAQPDREHTEKQLREVTTMLARPHPKVAAIVVDAQPVLLAFAAFPRRHQISSTDPLQRLNKETRCRRRRRRAPDSVALLRLAGSVLMEEHDEWEAGGRRCFSESSMLELSTMNDSDEIIDEAAIVPESLLSRLYH
jgi:putative transposase